MALKHASAGTPVFVGPLGQRLALEKTTTLINEPGLQIFRLVLLAGKRLEEHQVPQALVFHCIEGEVVFHTLGREVRMSAGELCFIAKNEVHAVTALTAASALVMLHGFGPAASPIDIQESST